MKVGFVSLGCSKNLVDTEMMIGLFKENQYEIVNNPEEANIIVINTCGFIVSAKEEAINTILEMAKYKEKNCKYLIVTGCLVERYKDELIKEIPEVDLFVKFSEYENIWEQITNVIEEKQKHGCLDFCNRVVTTGKNFAYLRIAEGCNNFCTFCAIPYIRGRYTSRKIEDILNEAKNLASSGIKELIIIAQDTTKYGIDIYGKSQLAKLLNELSKIEGIEWIRFLYAYPESIDNELIREVKTNDKICKYFDIPIQHISDKILKKMNRKSKGENIKKLIVKLRNEIPNVVIRSTVMVGFPGETEVDFGELYEFIKWAKLDKLGCFTYSKEEGTVAYNMENQIHPMTKKKRYNRIMRLQQEISRENMKKHFGKTLKVLVEETGIGRTYMDVPDIDGVVYLKGNTKLNSFTDCKITDVREYDLEGEIINK